MREVARAEREVVQADMLVGSVNADAGILDARTGDGQAEPPGEPPHRPGAADDGNDSGRLAVDLLRRLRRQPHERMVGVYAGGTLPADVAYLDVGEALRVQVGAQGAMHFLRVLIRHE